MRKVFWFVVRYAVMGLIFMAMSMAAALATQTSLGLKIGLLDEPEIASGETLDIAIEFSNRSGSPISISESEGDYAGGGDYTLYVLDGAGISAPLTDEGRDFYQHGDAFSPGISRAVSLLSGQSVASKLRVTEIYDLTRPGSYVLWVERKLPAQLGGGYLISNSIGVTVTQ